MYICFTFYTYQETMLMPMMTMFDHLANICDAIRSLLIHLERRNIKSYCIPFRNKLVLSQCPVVKYKHGASVYSAKITRQVKSSYFSLRMLSEKKYIQFTHFQSVINNFYFINPISFLIDMHPNFSDWAQHRTPIKIRIAELSTRYFEIDPRFARTRYGP